MWSRRAWLAAAAGAPEAARAACSSLPLRPLRWSDLPAAAARLAPSVGVDEAGWEAREQAAAGRGAERIREGSAEHLIYYALQSRRFTARAPLDPARLAALGTGAGDAAVAGRLEEFRRTITPARDERHRWMGTLYASLPAEWTLERAYAHTMRFLAGRERGARAGSAAARQAALDALYQRRGASSDTQPSSTAVIEAALGALAGETFRRVILAGPGLDLTRREGFDDARPLQSHQAEALRRRLPGAELWCLDVRPEVLGVLGEAGYCVRRADVTAMTAAGAGADLVIATNLLVYFDEAELLLAMTALGLALAPGGRLVHNDARFAAKVLGEAAGMPVETFQPVRLGYRGEVEQMDRMVIHRRRG